MFLWPASAAGLCFVAALNGWAMGGGCELALACDTRIMADGDYGIGQPEILFAFPPGGGGTQRLARMLGSTRALRSHRYTSPCDGSQRYQRALRRRRSSGRRLPLARIHRAAHF